MTEPYLQTATDHSIWISWKTDFDNTPEVMFGKSEDNLDATVGEQPANCRTLTSGTR